MRKIDNGLRRIQRAIDKIANDRFTPATTTPEVTDYLIDLANTDTETQQRMAGFLIALPADAIRWELLIQTIPAELRDEIHNLRAEHEDLQLKKEAEIENADFDAAAKARDKQFLIYENIQKRLFNIQLSVTPSVIDAALKSLGWNTGT